nr:PKD domain-containing protein [Erythrobacter crassostrea]
MGGATVSLPAAATDPENDPITYGWAQLSGPPPASSFSFNTGTGELQFTAPSKTNAVQAMTFEMEANDGTSIDTDTVDVLIAANQIPVPVVGPAQSVGAGQTVNLDASASTDPDGDPLTFSWSQLTSGTPVTLINGNTATPSFVSPTVTSPQVIDFQVSVSDGLTSDLGTIRVTINPNEPPTVDAGPDQNVSGGDTVNLAATGSDAEGDPITYQWLQTAGPSVTLTGGNTATPTFTAPPRAFNDQTITFEVVASDAGGAGPSDFVDIIIAGNQAPTANAGAPQNVAGGTVITLDGTGSSDPENDALIYSWVQVTGPTVVLTGANTPTATFTAPPRTNSDQILEFALTVTDVFDASSSASTTTTVLSNNLPIADAGADQSQVGGSTITLDGSGSSDPDGDAINYTWVQNGGPLVVLTGANTVNPTFTAPTATSVDQILTFDLTVDDNATSGGAGSGARQAPSSPQQDSVQITILANTAPVADAGTDQGPIDSGETVTLNGSGSTDPEGDSLTYIWTQIAGTPVTLTGGNSVSPTFVAPTVNGNEDLVFALRVNDGQLDSPVVTVTVSVQAVGTVTIIQQLVGGGDTPVTFTSSVAGLNGIVNTVSGTGQISATSVAAGSYSVSVNDLTGQGFALTDITCNDGDSVANIAGRSVAIELSPSEDLVCTFTSVNSREAASAAIADFLTGRNALIMSHQPDLQRRLDRLDGQSAPGGSASAFGVPVPGSGALPFDLSIVDGRASASTSLSQVMGIASGPDRTESDFDIWGEAFFSRAQLGNQRASFQIFHVGADYRISENLLIGALGEFDNFNDRDDLEAGEAEGNGWMVGPYVMTRLAPTLFAEVRAAWGKSDNRVSPLGTYTDEFETNRAFYSGSFVGQFDLSKRTQVRPELTVRYLDETQIAYTDSLNVIIPEQRVGQGDISFRPRVQHRIELESGWTLRPFAEVEGIYTFGTSINNVLENGLRARVEGGLDMLSKNGIRASIGAFHDGIGADNFGSTGGHVSISFGF